MRTHKNKKTRSYRRLAPLLLAAALLCAPLLLSPGCAHSPTDQAVKDTDDLQLTVTTFHRDMRWSRWEAAAASVAPHRRQAFLGRYKELGDDFHISNLEIKTLEPLKTEVIIDIEQESYTEPAMIVKKERYIEVWEKLSGGWQLTERMPKDDFIEMNKVEERTEPQDSSTPDTTKADSPDAAILPDEQTPSED